MYFSILIIAAATLITGGTGTTSTTVPYPFSLDPPTGRGRCCFESGGDCLTDSHCLPDCVDGGNLYDCKNCECWVPTTGCCKEQYACMTTGSKLPRNGICEPYCTPDPDTGAVCHGHGTCQAPNSCACNPGWNTTQDCLTCDTVHYGSTCEACRVGSDGAVCSHHGTCDGAGTMSGDGACSCDAGWADGSDSTPCSQCAQGYGPPGDCSQFVCAQTCQHGTCSAPNTCTCLNGWSGASCDTTTCADITPTGSPECSGNGKCTAPDVCTCKEGFQGTACEVGIAECCATVSCSQNPKQCNSCCQYPQGHPGECTNPGYQCKGCDCGVKDGRGTQGCCGESYCQERGQHKEEKKEEKMKNENSIIAHDVLRQLSGKDPTYHCCPTNKAGNDCENCATGYYGKECQPCPGGSPVGTNRNPCSGHGICLNQGASAGTCKCSYGYTGEGCSQCETNKFKCPDNCNLHGICGCPKSSPSKITNSTRGECSCEPGYEGTSCAACSIGYWMNNAACVKCKGCLMCNPSTGMCITTPSPTPNSPQPPTPPGQEGVGTYILYGLVGGTSCVVVGSLVMFLLQRSPNKSTDGTSDQSALLQNSSTQRNVTAPEATFDYTPPETTTGDTSSNNPPADMPDFDAYFPEMPDLPGSP